jgi:predicted helicase
VAIMFLLKKTQKDNKTCQIRYISMDDFWRKEEKLQWFAQHRFKDIPFETIYPDKNNNWLNITDNNWEELIPICSKDVKAGKNKLALFELYSTGISTNRDEWIIDFSKENLSNKMKFFADFFNNNPKAKEFDTEIKWSRNLKQRYERGLKELFSLTRLIHFNYRPYIPVFLYYSDVFIDEHGLADQIFVSHNRAFCISGIGSSKPFQILGVSNYPSLDFLEKTQCLPLYRYDKQSNRLENITEWGLQQFRGHYEDTTITKENIFHYVYGVLHNPDYRTKYEFNLKRDFPRIPFYDNFWQWAAWGKTLMELHINYETVEPYPLKEIKIEDTGKPKPKLKADKELGCIVLDEATTLTGIPSAAWEYKLGNRSALEWILDQYKEKKPTDQTIAEKFNTYRFADYKLQVIDLLKRVCTVSVETVKIIKEMESRVKV